MKKKILAVLIALSLLGVGLFQVIPALAATGPLDHIVLTPTTASVPVNNSQQFTVTAYTTNNQTAGGVSYLWVITTGSEASGSITSSGLFTAGSVPGTYTDAVEVVAVQGSVTKIAYASVTVTGTPGPIDHITVTPATATVTTGTTQQFTAQAYDAAGVAIPGLSYTWGLNASNIGILNNGLFTAGTTNSGTFTNAIQATAVDNGVTATGMATVTITVTPTTTTTTTTTTSTIPPKALFNLFRNFVNNNSFADFLGGQFQVKNGTVVDTIQLIPGVVQSASAASITITPNGQATVTYTLTSNTGIFPKDTQLAVNDNVIVVTDNGQVSLVVNVTNSINATNEYKGQLPPGLQKKGENELQDRSVPGWTHGKKVGWNKSGCNCNDSGNESDDD